MKRALYLLMILGLLVGCSTMKVVTDYSESADFSRFKTFQDKETDMTIADRNTARINRGISRVFQKFPPASAS